jgi:hypothetical protein
MFGTQPDDLEGEILKAKKKLAEFENGSSYLELTARLAQSNPMHPFLLARTLSIAGATFCIILLLVALIGSAVSRDVAQAAGAVEDVLHIPLPVALGVLTAVLGLFGLLGFGFAVSAGRDAPYLPHEAKVHQRLMSDVQQLEAKRSVKERMTPKPATPRLLDRRGR